MGHGKLGQACDISSIEMKDYVHPFLMGFTFRPSPARRARARLESATGGIGRGCTNEPSVGEMLVYFLDASYHFLACLDTHINIRFLYFFRNISCLLTLSCLGKHEEKNIFSNFQLKKKNPQEKFLSFYRPHSFRSN